MKLQTTQYLEQQACWPQTGKHILAQHDNSSIIVYQAFRPSIVNYALAHGRFGGDFSFTRMSWIKPNFLWMMYRCGWCEKEEQKRVLAIRLSVEFFDWLLSQAVKSTFDATQFDTQEEWKSALQQSCVRLQWDPDHDPLGGKLPRKAIQLGLRGEALRRYGQEEALEISDITSFVEEQRLNIKNTTALLTPLESVYTPRDKAAIGCIGLDAIA